VIDCGQDPIASSPYGYRYRCLGKHREVVIAVSDCQHLRGRDSCPSAEGVNPLHFVTPDGLTVRLKPPKRGSAKSTTWAPPDERNSATGSSR
jgi:hypothetical protein